MNPFQRSNTSLMLVALTGLAPALTLAQQTGTPGSPGATTSIDGKLEPQEFKAEQQNELPVNVDADAHGALDPGLQKYR